MSAGRPTGAGGGADGAPDGAAPEGWIVLDKPAGITSAAASRAVGRLLGAARVGHGGTLDPAATGVLPIALGRATRLLPWALGGRKTYRFRAVWGAATDTDDAGGAVLAASEARPAPEALAAALARLEGDILQRPPAFSAVRVAGRRAHELARAGRPPRLEPRPARVHRLVLAAPPAPGWAELEAEVGAGAYVRALARDLGEALGCLGHADAIRRTAAGPFRIGDAAGEEALRDPGAARRALLPLEAGLAGMPRVELDPAAALDLSHGRAPPAPPGAPEGRPLAAFAGARAAAVVEARAGRLAPLRVLAPAAPGGA